MLMDVARGFLNDKAPTDKIREFLESDQGYEPQLWKEIVDLGWAGIALPEMVGGAGLGVSAVIPVVEAMGHALLGTPLIDSTLAGQLLLRAGTAEHEPLLEEIAGGRIATVAFLDGGDWGGANLALDIAHNGVLNGTKTFVGCGHEASLILVLGQCDGEPAIAVVDAADLKPDAVSVNTLIDLTKRTAQIDFTGVQAKTVLTGERVVTAIRDYRLLGALLTAAEAAGSAARCLAVIIDYLKTRKQFGKLIGSYQALKHPTVDIYCGVEDARSFCYHAASLLNDEPLSHDAEIACRMAKVSAGQTMSYAGDRAVQFHGGIGFTWDCDSTLFIRRGQWSHQVFGDAIHHRKRLASLLLD
jgi:alkylation response protein AidB-like acyl-CoA dehydrogenase